MIIDQAHRLHECIHRRRPHKGPTTLSQVLRHRNRLRRGSHGAQSLVRNLTWPCHQFGLKLPEICRKRAELGAHFLRPFGIVDARSNLATGGEQCQRRAAGA